MAKPPRNVVRVPDITHPTLCYREGPNPTLGRCDRPKGHKGPHLWELVALVASHHALLVALRALHDDIAEYARINNLGGFDNHCMKQARAALQLAEEGQ